MRVLIAASSEISQKGLYRLLSDSEFVVAGTMIGLQGLTTAVLQHQPDIAILECEFINDQLFSLLKEVGTQIPILVLSNHIDALLTSKLIRSGARAILSRDSSRTQMLATLNAILQGLVVLQPDGLDSNSARAARSNGYYESLTGRELEVLKMLGAGLGNKEIAARLEISGHTVKFHINSIFTKLNVSSRTEAVTTGLRLGLISL